MSKRFATAASGNTYNSVSDFPTTGSGFGVNTQALTLYAGFVIPEYSRICFMNYGGSPDAAISAVSQSGEIYSAFRSSGTWQNGKVSASKDDLTPAKYTGFTAGTGKTIVVNKSYKIGNLLIACLKIKIGTADKEILTFTESALNNEATPIIGMGTEWNITSFIYTYLGENTLITNTGTLTVGQYLHIYIPIVLK